MRNIFLAGLMCIPLVAYANDDPDVCRYYHQPACVPLVADAYDDPEVVVLKKALVRRTTRVTACYKTELARQPTLEGVLKITFIVTTKGRARRPSVDSNTTDSRFLAECVVRALRRMTVTPPPSVEMVVKEYTYNFSPVRRENNDGSKTK